MDLFTIQCTTCQARLKVHDESVIGEILACPKCGSMVQVVPPVGWKRAGTSEIAQGDSAAPRPRQDFLTASSSLKAVTSPATTRPAAQPAAVPPALPSAAAREPASPAPATSKGTMPRTQTVTSVAAPAIPVSAAAATAPSGWRATLASGWQAIAARIKRDWIFLASGLGGGVLLGGAVWLALSSAIPPVAVTQLGPPAPTLAASSSSAPRVADSRPIDAQPTTSEEQSIERRAPEQPSAPPPTSDSAVQSAVQTVASIAPSDPRQAEPGGDPTAPGATETPATETRPPAPAVKLDPIVSRAEDRPAPDEAARTARDQEDASAADVSAEPSAQAAESAPAKHPSAAPPRLSQSEIDERLASALPRVEFVKVPLAQFVEFIGEFTNLPIVIDEPALHAIGKGRQSLVSVKLSDATAGEALRAATAKLGLTCAAREGKLVVTAAHRAAKAK